MFKLKDFKLDKWKNEITEIIKQKLESLPALIPEIKYYEIGINVSNSERAYDIVVISHFLDAHSYKKYSENPIHQEVLEFIKKNIKDSKIVDFISEK